MSVRVEQVDAAVTRALRLAVLRNGDSGYSTAPGDTPGAVHLAARDGDEVVGAVVLLAEACPLWPDRPGLRLRGMAVAPARQGTGVGSLVLAAACARLDDEVLWCNARASARRFYERHGFVAEGEEFRTGDTGLPHFLMWWNPDGAPPRPSQ